MEQTKQTKGNEMKSESRKEFNKKIARFERVCNAGWNYVYHTLKKSRLSNGFWNNYGYTIDDLLEDFKQNYMALWTEYCDKKGMCSDVGVDDLFC